MTSSSARLRQTVLIIDDEDEALSELSRYFARWHVHTAQSLTQLQSQLASLEQLDLALIDLHLMEPQRHADPWPDGFTAVGTIRTRFPSCRITLVTSSLNHRLVNHAAELRVGYISKRNSQDALERLARERIDPSDGHEGFVRGLADAHGLTPRHCEVLMLALSAIPRKEIAERLEITEGTVKMHISAIIRRCGATNIAEIRRDFRQWKRHGGE